MGGISLTLKTTNMKLKTSSVANNNDTGEKWFKKSFKKSRHNQQFYTHTSARSSTCCMVLT